MKLIQCAIAGLVLTPLLGGTAFAQVDPASPNSNPGLTNASTLDLRIPIRAGVGYSTDGGGYEGAFNFEGFLPLSQRVGRNITFLNGRFFIDNDANTGGSLILGHRFYSLRSDRIWGGYLAYDNRSTDRNTFNQFGFGLETMGKVWDVRFNAYLPMGDTRQSAGEQSIDNILQTSGTFQGNLLVLDALIERQRIRDFEAAVGGFDLEAGARLARWQYGDLRGYAGIYYYDAPERDGSFGWRVRLDADVNRSLNFGVALQHDEIFGTNLMASVALTLPGIRPRGPVPYPQMVPARLGEPIARNPHLVLDVQQEVERSTEQVTMPLMNPEEEQPYRFHHVTLGIAAGGNGTFERPFGTVQEALNATRSDGNDVVYVDAGSNPAIPAFTIPDRVQVLSQGPVQLLGGMPFPGFPQTLVRLPFSPQPNYSDGVLVQLPLSGDGRFPLIQQAGAVNLVSLGDRTILGGFRLTGATENAILGQSIANVELRNNTITNSGQRGIFLNNVIGSVVMLDNTVIGSRGDAGSGQGILIRSSTDDAVEITMSRHRLTDQRVGLELSTLGDRTQNLSPSQIVSIDNLIISSSRDQGMLILANGSGNQQVAFRSGSISGSGAQGLFVQALNTGTQELILEDSTIRNSGGAGLEVLGGTLGRVNTAAQEVYVRRNVIENNRGAGIDITANEVSAQEFGINNNTIRNNGGPGIRAIANNSSFQEFVTDADNQSEGISNNQISGNQGAGIIMTTNDASTQVSDIQGNTLTANRTNGAPDLSITLTNSAGSACVVLLNNRSASGIRLNNNSMAPRGLFEVGDLPTVSVRNNGGVSLLPNAAAFTNKPGATSCFR